MSTWQSINTAPVGVEVLLWWRPKADPAYPKSPEAKSVLSDNKYAEQCVIGQVSEHEEGQWWNGQRGEYQDIWHVTHWMPLPKSPTE